MNILSINGTCITNKDCIAKQLKEMADTCLACVKESATNTCDVDITKYVSHTIIWVAVICAGAYLLSKLIASIHATRIEKKKREWDKEDRLSKQESEAWNMKLQWLKGKDEKKTKGEIKDTEEWGKHYLTEIDKYISKFEKRISKDK